MLLDLPINPGDMATTQRLQQHSRKIHFHDLRGIRSFLPRHKTWHGSISFKKLSRLDDKLLSSTMDMCFDFLHRCALLWSLLMWDACGLSLRWGVRVCSHLFACPSNEKDMILVCLGPLAHRLMTTLLGTTIRGGSSSRPSVWNVIVAAAPQQQPLVRRFSRPKSLRVENFYPAVGAVASGHRWFSSEHDSKIRNIGISAHIDR
jgi:hypothetical protein